MVLYISYYGCLVFNGYHQKIYLSTINNSKITISGINISISVQFNIKKNYLMRHIAIVEVVTIDSSLLQHLKNFTIILL